MSVPEIYAGKEAYARATGREELRSQSRGGEVLCCWFTSCVGRTLVFTIGRESENQTVLNVGEDFSNVTSK